MKIVPDHNNPVYYKNLNTEKIKQDGLGPVSEKKVYDTISLRGNQDAVSDDVFVRQLKEKLLEEVKTPASEKELEEIKMQLEENNYYIGIDEIIKKMLL